MKRRALLAAALAAGPLHAQRPRRTALVIGNAAYETAALANPVRDAELVAGALRGIGFDVALARDLALAPMNAAIDDWLQRGVEADARFFFYAGHGAQFRGRNYLLPVDAELAREDDILAAGVNATELVDRIGRLPRGVNAVVLDACRDAPFPITRRMPGVRSRAVVGSSANELLPALPARGTLLAYSTSPGAVAYDGKDGHSAYARHLAAQLASPGLTVEAVFKRVRQAVARDTGNRQVPWDASSLVGEFCLVSGPGGACPAVPAGSVDLGARAAGR